MCASGFVFVLIGAAGAQVPRSSGKPHGAIVAFLFPLGVSFYLFGMRSSATRIELIFFRKKELRIMGC
jgi:hypothetical protein